MLSDETLLPLQASFLSASQLSNQPPDTRHNVKMLKQHWTKHSYQEKKCVLVTLFVVCLTHVGPVVVLIENICYDAGLVQMVMIWMDGQLVTIHAICFIVTWIDFIINCVRTVVIFIRVTMSIHTEHMAHVSGGNTDLKYKAKPHAIMVKQTQFKSMCHVNYS